ncbi:hypothetical protein EW146_g6521 [Bondarzewia mesenterica]|uniref:BTB domain-containing protein n=1 Tax=Bondarzewia mesenterica TaxID=1095465 RepID=A0A4S4LQD1_9AGAM|nr:hypothetical protein EW146_g6521 [Bondarzewia mesenterica]
MHHLAPPSSAPGIDDSFVRGCSPPPPLAGVPLEYIIASLRGLAKDYYNNLSNADCTIIYPAPVGKHRKTGIFEGRAGRAMKAPYIEMSTSSHDFAGLGRRTTAPALDLEPEMLVSRLHVDYLVLQSRLCRSLLGSKSSLDLTPVQDFSSSTQSHAPAATMSSQLPTNPTRFARLIPSLSTNPVLFLPIPDPDSFHHLIYWLYHGDTTIMERALDNDVIEWAGLVSNVQYLGLSSEIHMFLGWYYEKMEGRRHSGRHRSGDTDEDMEEPQRGRLRNRTSASPKFSSPDVQPPFQGNLRV